MTDRLAIDSGQPVRSKPFAPWPSVSEDEISAVVSVLRSGKINYWTGPEGKEFEKEFAEYTGCKHAVAVANGTVALELALVAGGIGVGDEVIVTPRSFVASASCAVMRGAIPVFADIDPDSQNITAETISRVITKRTKAIIAVHLAGWPCDMGPIMALAKKHNLLVIEDCAQCHGARYKNRPVGSLGHIAAFSFCQDKIMTTGGEGGMITTNDTALWEKAWSFKDHGKSFDAVFKEKHPPGFRWLHRAFGTNWRLTEMQSAIGRVLLRRLNKDVSIRRKHAAELTDCFSNISALRVTTPPTDIFHSYYKYYVFVRPEMLKANWSRDRIMEAVSKEGVPCFSGSCSEMYLEAAFNESMRPPNRLPVANELGETSLMFLVHPTLGEDEIADTCKAVTKVFREASA